MKFKHTFNVLIDNFRVTYKLLVYLLIIIVITIGISSAIVIPFFNRLSGVEYYENIADTLGELINGLLHGNLGDLYPLETYFDAISENFMGLLKYLGEHPADLVLSSLGLLLLGLVGRFFVGLGNYAACAVINDKMAMQANSPFTATLIKNLGKASLYAVIYTPISFVYDAICIILLYLVLSSTLGIFSLLSLFLFFTCMVLLTGVKMLFTTDWLPAMICGKMSVTRGLAYSFTLKGGSSGGVYSFFASSAVAILALNVLAAISTFCAALIITIPLSYLYLLCYELVNYCDNNEIKYFTDKHTIVKPEHEKETSREEFLRGE